MHSLVDSSLTNPGAQIQDGSPHLGTQFVVSGLLHDAWQPSSPQLDGNSFD